jgi:hypothetical protein
VPPGYSDYLPRISYRYRKTDNEYKVTFDLKGGADKSMKEPTYSVWLINNLGGLVAITVDSDPKIIASSNQGVVVRSIREFHQWR